jgi:hypothetical protein
MGLPENIGKASKYHAWETQCPYQTCILGDPLFSDKPKNQELVIKLSTSINKFAEKS